MRKPLPVRKFFLQLLFAGFGQGVELGFSPGVGLLPFRRDPALLFESMERRIERALGDLQRIFADLFDPFCDGPAMLWLDGNGFKDE